MVALDTVNSRMKDFFDIWYLANWMEFDLGLLVKPSRTPSGKEVLRFQMKYQLH
jgi:hypothetical protein